VLATLHRPWHAAALLCLAAAVAIARLAPAHAAAVSVLTVTTTADTSDGMCTPDDCSLRDALAVATAGATIVIPRGTFTLSSALTINVPVTLQGAGADDTIIQAATSPGVAGYRVFDINATGTVALLDLTVRHGALIDPGGAESGGAILWIGSGTLEITRSNIVFNLVNVDGSPNGGAAAGGALFLGGGIALIITDSTIADNELTSRGAIQFGGALSGGAIFAGQVVIVRSTVARNQAVASGPVSGGAGSGGAIFASSVILTDSTVSGNLLTAGAQSGGAIFADTQAFSSTIADNTGGGVPIDGRLTARNSIFARNSPHNCIDLVSNGYVLVEDDSGCSITPGPGDLIGTFLDPIETRLGPLTKNGGPTETQALNAGSPAIDGGNPAGCVDQNDMPILVDQRGFPRTQDGNGDGIAVCDMGAFEFAFAKRQTTPVLGQWGLVLLCAGLAALALRHLRRAG